MNNKWRRLFSQQYRIQADICTSHLEEKGENALWLIVFKTHQNAKAAPPGGQGQALHQSHTGSAHAQKCGFAV